MFHCTNPEKNFHGYQKKYPELTDMLKKMEKI
jgi:hypothetical protein